MILQMGYRYLENEKNIHKSQYYLSFPNDLLIF